MSYLPSTESELKDFALNFAALILAAPATYGLVAGDATDIDEAVQAFAAAYELAYNPATRNAGTIDAKNTAKTTMTAILRGYAMTIKPNRAVTNLAKIALGIGAYDSTPTPVPVPSGFPLLNVVRVIPRQHELRFADSATPERRSKPAGAIGMQFFCHVGLASAGAPEDPLDCRFRSFITRNPIKMDFAAADVGKMAFYFGRWQTGTGLVGPWSQMVSITIA